MKFDVFVVFQSAKESCGGDYVNVDDNNTACVTDLATIDQVKETKATL